MDRRVKEVGRRARRDVSSSSMRETRLARPPDAGEAGSTSEGLTRLAGGSKPSGYARVQPSARLREGVGRSVGERS